ncbi:MAG: type II toxin-antitoxin system VapC family toxin [Armatimonadetes bacterium]|nr:type II toxin-antitoxin system VapC family toxin [Armatimonadota bacterium]
MLTHLLDTSVFSQPIKDHPVAGAMARWAQLGDGSACTGAICLAEVLQGLELRQSVKYWRRYRELLEHRYPVLAFDEAVAATYGELASSLARLGTPRPALDLMIASTAKTHGLIVATLDSRDFSDIPGLAVEDWSTTTDAALA